MFNHKHTLRIERKKTLLRFLKTRKMVVSLWVAKGWAFFRRYASPYVTRDKRGP